MADVVSKQSLEVSRKRSHASQIPYRLGMGNHGQGAEEKYLVSMEPRACREIVLFYTIQTSFRELGEWGPEQR